MQVKAQCTSCEAVYNVAEASVGRTATCKGCQRQFIISVLGHQDGGAAASPRAPKPQPKNAANHVSSASERVAPKKPTAPAASKVVIDGSPLSKKELEQLRETERWRSRIRVASVLCVIVFWGAVVYGVAFSLGGIFALAEARRTQDRVAAAALLVSALVIGGIAVLSRIAGQANRRCERWAPMSMCILEAVNVVGLVVMGIFLALEGGMVALILMCIGALIPSVLATLFYRSWVAIPEYMSRPSWCRRTLECCGL